MDEHPLLRALWSVDAALDAAAGIDPAFLPTRDKERALQALQQELSRLEGLRMRLLADAGDVADEHAARSAGVGWRSRCALVLGRELATSISPTPWPGGATSAQLCGTAWSTPRRRR